MSTIPKSILAKLERLIGRSLNGVPDNDLRQLADESVEKARAGIETDLLSKPKLVEGLELRGDLFRYLEDSEKARDDYEEVLSLLKEVQDADGTVGRVCAELAVSYDLSGDGSKAKSYYKEAIRTLRGLDPLPVIDIAELNNNLAFIYESEEEYDKAETCFLDALKSCYEELGPEHKETAVFYNNVGSFYFKLEHDEQAGKMHGEALKTRVELFGELHLETAQSYANLALVLVRSGQVAEGLAHFEKALAGFESDLDTSGCDYEIVAANYRDVLVSMRDKKAVKSLNQRLKKNGFS
ncbi:MAG: tetratricopeptide repeat protein [Akkermansiaceae bacterium]